MFSRVLLRRNDPASARSSAVVDDIESQPLSPTDPSFEPQMAERPQSGLSRWSFLRPTVPSRLRFSSSTEVTSAVPSDWPGTRTARTSRSNTIPMPRPTSSRYPGDDDYEDLESQWGSRAPPMPSRYSVALDLPSSRLDLPGLQRTWTQENGATAHDTSRPSPKESLDNPYKPPSYPPLPTVTLTEPEPVAQPNARRTNRSGYGDIDELFDEVDRAYGGGGFNAPDPEESQLAGLAEDGRRRRHKKHRGERHRGERHRSDRHRSDRHRSGRHRSDRDRSGTDRDRRHRHRRDRTHHEGHGHSEGHSGERRRKHRRRKHRKQSEDGDESEGPHPKHFMFCFPWVRNRKMRSQIVQSVVSGFFLICLLAVYLALAVTKAIKGSEFTVLMILIILVAAIFFCQAAVRLCMLIFRPKKSSDDRRRHRLPRSDGPGGYAVPREPIRVVLARDEEAAGIESEETKMKPPAYGLWRESVRVDPDRIYWQRNPEVVQTPRVEEHEVFSDREEEADDDDQHHHRYHHDDLVSSEDESEDEEGTSGDEGGRSHPRPTIRRPPSYVSEDGVSYVVEARPRSMAPAMDVPLPVHPAEVGRVALPARW
ncbi:hypothetical protein VP1G_04004 [Cytospora mali]|uniref:Uncharacterized protein n=1 Tax=Cytospora mali TaxID=578113 RepID=A0A194UYA4_CYTMA|nr:hypothetical protein VP1G_04004 [Valsa mali var. pyri (nom. inval.)]